MGRPAMMCSDCGKKEAFAKGLCSTCYARARRKSGGKPCGVEGCDRPAVDKGLCSKHAQRVRAKARARTLPDLPGERWQAIDRHPGWFISTEGRVKSIRGSDERLIKPRMANGRLFIEDRTLHRSFAVHLQVLKTFSPAAYGDPVFIDGNPAHPALANLRWDTRADKVRRAIAMAESSPSKWAAAFTAYWRGDRGALDDFLAEARQYLLKAVHKKCDGWGCWYRLDVEDLVYEVLVHTYFQIHAATLKNLDNLHGYMLTVSDSILARHWRYARPMVPIMDDRGTEPIMATDVAGIAMPSPETLLLEKEVSLKCCG